jgi:hypothetical protein
MLIQMADTLGNTQPYKRFKAMEDFDEAGRPVPWIQLKGHWLQ